jgi:hypothetical protein
MIRFWIFDLGLRIFAFRISDFKNMVMRLIGGLETTSSLLTGKL